MSTRMSSQIIELGPYIRHKTLTPNQYEANALVSILSQITLDILLPTSICPWTNIHTQQLQSTCHY